MAHLLQRLSQSGSQGLPQQEVLPLYCEMISVMPMDPLRVVPVLGVVLYVGSDQNLGLASQIDELDPNPRTSFIIMLQSSRLCALSSLHAVEETTQWPQESLFWMNLHGSWTTLSLLHSRIDVVVSHAGALNTKLEWQSSARTN